VRYRWEHGAREQWWLVGDDNSIGVAIIERPSHPEPPYTRYTISGRLVHHGQEFTSLVEARSAAEDIATAAGHAIAV
jgi:hypothetical protein